MAHNGEAAAGGRAYDSFCETVAIETAARARGAPPPPASAAWLAWCRT
jgi:hypothetical protein